MSLQYQLAYTLQGFKCFWGIVITWGFLLIAIPFFLKIKGIIKSIKAMVLPMYILAIVMLALGVLFGYCGRYDESMCIYMVSLCFLQSSILLLFFYNIEFGCTVTIQMVIISLGLFVWYGAAIAGKITIDEYPSIKYAGLIVVTTNLIFWIKKIYDCRSQIIGKICISYSRQDAVAILSLLASVVILSAVFTWKLPFLWDSADYMVDLLSAARWEFTLGNIDKLDLCSHHAAGYAFLTLPGVWLFDDPFLGVHVMQTVMLCITAFMFWEILRIRINSLDYFERLLITIVFTFTPAVFGLSSGYSLDYGLLCITVWVVFSWVGELEIFKLLFGLFMCTTKEPAIVLYAGMAFGLYLFKILRINTERKKMFTCLAVHEWLTLTIPVVWWLAIDKLMARNPNYTNNWKGEGYKWLGYVSEINTVPNNFGLSLRYIAIQLIHEFVINFEWIIVICLIGLVVYVLVKRREILKSIDYALLLPFGCGITIFTIFHVIYITHPHYRYVAVVLPLLLLIMVDILSKVIIKQTIRKAFCFCVAILFLIQTFRSVDPLTNFFGHKLSTGNSFIINYDILNDEKTNFKISDYTLYNLQGNQYGGALNKAFSDMDMNNALVVVPNENGEMMYSALGGRAVEDGHSLGYSTKSGMFSPVEASGYTNCGFGILDENTGDLDIYSEISDVMLFDNIYYIDLPFSTIYDIEEVLNRAHFKILDKADYSYYGGWKIGLYTIEPFCDNLL